MVTVLTDSFIEFFKGRLGQLEQIYKWPITANAKRTFKSFRLNSFQWSDESNPFHETVTLKKQLSELWAIYNEEEQLKLARWVVSDWGGVRANRNETLRLHLKQIADDNGNRPLRGVASYSKILSAADYTRYAIYDARVAACLNAIQLKTTPEQPLFFHYIPSRNKLIRQFEQTFPKRELVNNRNWTEVSKDSTYMTYLELLRLLKNEFPGTEIYHFEMILFAEAPIYCEDIVNHLSKI